jgi:4-amino-4-deoxy-L-arabinose transferase-like glycosyltransferase
MKYLTPKNIIILFLLVASYFSIFFQLGSDDIYLWDEGTYAVNAYEMHLRGDYLVKYYGGVPEMWATNPPLVCYLQTLCIKLLGPSEVAIRLPSALAALGVVLLIIRFSIKEKLGMDFAAYAVLALLSTKGYICFHVTRTGDLDSVLIFFITGSIMYFYKFIEYEKEKIKYLMVFSLFILLGYFTKGIACFMILPALFIYNIIKNKLLYVLKIKQLYLFIFLVLTLICLYYYLRELRTPGYISFTWKSEVGRWYTEGKEHVKPFFYYIQHMYENDFKYYLLLIPAFIIMFFFLPKNNVYKNKSVIWIITSITFLLIISSSKTKLEWYEAPVYPMFSIILALGFKSIIDFKIYTPLINFIVKGVFVFALFSAPYFGIVKDNSTSYVGWHDVYFGKALKRYNEIANAPKKIEMLVTGYNGHALFYKMLYNDKYNYDITIRDVAGNIYMVPGVVYLFTHPAILDYLKQTFNYEIIMDRGGMLVVKTLSYKTT